MNVFPLLGNSVENEERKRERERDEVEECKALHANKMKNAQWIWNDDDNRKIFWILDFVKRCWIDEKFFDLKNLIILFLRRILLYRIVMKEINEYLFQDFKCYSYIVINVNID